MCAAGPKNYVFCVFNPETGEYKSKCTIRGFTLNYANEKIINFNKMRNMIMNNAPPVQVVNEKKIARTKDYQIITTLENKTYQMVYRKEKGVRTATTQCRMALKNSVCERYDYNLNYLKC